MDASFGRCFRAGGECPSAESPQDFEVHRAGPFAILPDRSRRLGPHGAGIRPRRLNGPDAICALPECFHVTCADGACTGLARYQDGWSPVRSWGRCTPSSGPRRRTGPSRARRGIGAAGCVLTRLRGAARRESGQTLPLLANPVARGSLGGGRSILFRPTGHWLTLTAERTGLTEAARTGSRRFRRRPCGVAEGRFACGVRDCGWMRCGRSHGRTLPRDTRGWPGDGACDGRVQGR